MKDEDVRVIISMMVMCFDKVITVYDRRRSGLSNALVVIEYGNNITRVIAP